MTDQLPQIRALIKKLEEISEHQETLSIQMSTALSQMKTSRKDVAELLEMASETRMASSKLIMTAAMITKEKQLCCRTRTLFRKRHALNAVVH